MSEKSIIVGYKNSDKVWELASEGKFRKPFGSKLTLDTMQLCLMQYMAATTYDFPPTPDMKKRHLPSRLYERGWGHVAQQFGMWLPGGEETKEVFEQGGMQRVSEKNMQLAINRIGKASKKLQEAGLIKCIRKADIQHNVPAKWLLLIGDDEENRAVEAWARECTLVRFEADRKPWKKPLML